MATFVIENPATREQIAELDDADDAAVDRAVRAARDAFPAWSELPGRKRGRIMHRIADLLDDRAREIARLESTDNGRPVRETSAQQGIIGEWYRYFGGWADKIEGATIPVDGPYLNYTERVPVGVCAAITPWNHPLLIATKKIAPALACGNTVVVKPSELAPLSVIEFALIAREAGLPDGVVTVVTGQRETGAALTVHPGVDRVDVTGSTATGIAIMTQAAATMKRIGLELGGKAANVIFADADFHAAVQGALFAGYIGQGQTCIAGSRVLVERSLLNRFLEAFAPAAAGIRVGDPLVPGTQMGPQISAAALDRIEGFVEGAVADGATLVVGGHRPEVEERLRGGHFFTPTAVLTEDPTLRVAQEEIFGPVIAVIPFDAEADAVAIANAVDFGLGAAVWTRDVARAHRVARRLRSGTTWINDYHRIDPASPWGGFKFSGLGRENGDEAIRMFTEVKSTWVRLADPGPGWYEADDSARLN
jgi:acyl-CoA reductase-like NAD-dependent aldehyde dehydrogenase